MDLLPGQLTWSLVEMATPDSVMYIFSRHWLTIFYLRKAFDFEEIVTKPDLSTLGIGLLIPTLLLHLLTLWIGGFVQSKRKFARVMEIIKELPFLLITATLFILIYLGTRHFKADPGTTNRYLSKNVDSFKRIVRNHCE